MSKEVKRMKLKLARVEKELSQKKVAEYLGVSTARYNKIENGKGSPTLTQINMLMELLKVKVSVF